MATAFKFWIAKAILDIAIPLGLIALAVASFFVLAVGLKFSDYIKHWWKKHCRSACDSRPY